jgi:hypothetical protein
VYSSRTGGCIGLVLGRLLRWAGPVIQFSTTGRVWEGEGARKAWPPWEVAGADGGQRWRKGGGTIQLRGTLELRCAAL